MLLPPLSPNVGQEEPELGRHSVRTNGLSMNLVWVVRSTASMPYSSAIL